MSLRLLVLDAYAREGRQALGSAGGTEAGVLYRRMLERLAPGSRIDVLYPADADVALPPGIALADYDGIAWTGSSLSILAADDPRVARQLEFARSAYRARVPSFGSCWAAQLAVAAAGGRCQTSPRGREFGVARTIELSEAGRSHPLYRDKPAPFDAFTSHADEAVDLPAGTALLASNAWSRVQAVDVERGGGSFWAVQYHPEYDPSEVAALCRLRRDELVAQGSFPDGASADRYAADLDHVHQTGSAPAALELGPTLLDFSLRTLEVRNWLGTLR